MNIADSLQEASRALEAGDLGRAEEECRKVLQHERRNSRAWLMLGVNCERQGRLTEAVDNFQQAVEFDPTEASGHHHLGNALLQSGKHPEAEAAYRKCLELHPGLIDAIVNLGFVLGEQDRLDEAVAFYERARSLSPSVPEIHHNLGNMLRELGRTEQAAAAYDEALRLRPDYAKAYINKGILLVARGLVEEAAVCFRRGVELQPNFAEAHNGYGHSLSAGGDIDAAIAEFEHAIQLKPNYPDAHWNRSLLLLLQGDFERGWPAFEWRWRCKRTLPMPPIPQPRWDGSPLAGRTLLLHAEQGLGDTLQFVRYAPLVKAMNGKVILQCQGALMTLLTRCAGIDRFVPWGTPTPACDVWLPLMSLPAVLKTNLDTIPTKVPYLVADPVFVEHWRRELTPLRGFRVGIAWKGSPRYAWDRHRSVPMSEFEPLARVPGVHLVSLQKLEDPAEMNSATFPLIGFGESLDRAGAFTDTAAIMKNLDLVITVDTAIAHLAGGLGVPVWLALHRTPDWRWFLNRSDSPWYPTARLFRQRSVGAWGEVFREIAEQLSTLASRNMASQPLLIEVSAGELLDKLAILQIKAERIADPDKLRNIRLELSSLTEVRAALGTNPELERLERELKLVNERLWDIENSIRVEEQKQEFGSAFIELARSVYVMNDRRAELKREVNVLLKSRLVEEKSYAETKRV